MKIVMAGLIGWVLSVGAGAEPAVEGRVRLASGGPAAGVQVLVFDLADLSRYVGTMTDESGRFALSLGALGDGHALPAGFGLGQNYPNPFNPGTVIPYELAADGYVRLEVFNLLGQRVVTLVDGEMLAGRYTVAWDAWDEAGQGVAAGIYLYRLTVGGGTQTRRMTLVDGAAASTSPGGGVGSMVGMQGAGEAVYGLTVSGVGVETYVDADFRVGAGSVEVVVAAATGSGKAAQGVLLGDVSNDGRVNISDALIVATYSVNAGIVVPNNGDIELGDVNGDGRVNISDALIIATYSIDPTNPALPVGIGEPVEGGENQPPIAHAGPDQSVDRRETIVLDGSDSSDPEGRPLSFAWRQVAGDPVELSNAEVAEPTFNTQVTGLYAFELVVHDGRIASAPDTVGIEIVAISDAAVKVGSPDAALMYKEMTGDQMTFTVQGTAPPVEVGDVMVNTVEPYFLKKVISVQSQNATEVVVITENAAVTDVIEEAHIRRTFRFPAAKVVAGPELTIDNVSFGAWADADLSITRADLSFAREVDLDWEIWDSSSRFFKMHLTGEIVALLEMKFESSGGFSIAEEKGLKKFSYTQWLFPGGVPVVIEYEAEFGVGVDITVESASSITKGMRITKPVEMGVKYENGSWENLTGGGSATYEPLGPVVETEEALDIRGYLFGEVSTELYYLAGPFFGVRPYVGLGAAEVIREIRNQIEEDQIEWSLHTGVDGYVGVGTGFLEEIGIDDVGVEWDFNIFDYSLIDGVIPLIPDVLVDQLTVSPAAIVANTPTTVQVRVANRGPGRASPALVVLRMNGQVVDSAMVKLKAGEDTEVKFDPQVLEAGSHSIEVEVDPDGNLTSETVRGNNRVERMVTVPPVPSPATPDMVVDTLTLLPATIETHTPVTVQVRVANEGTATASGVVVALRVNGRVVDSIALDFDAGSETGVEFDPQVLGVGSHSIEVEVDPDENLTSERVRGNNLVSQTLTLTPQLASARSVVFILDLSGSMNDAAGDGGTRLEAAKAALAQVLAQAPRDGSQEYALTTFSGCGGVEVPIGFTGDPQTVVSYSSGLVADGGTPLATALRKGQHLALDEASSDDVLLVLLSDGEETCDGDPVGVARLIGQGVRAKAVASLGTQAKVIKVNAIGFGVEPGSAADQQIQAIAKETGGDYFRANEEADLAVALEQALTQTRVPTLSGRVTDEDGNPIQGALVQLRNMQENTDANGRYLFPARVQGVDSLIVTAAGYARYEAEVYLFAVDKEFDVRLTRGGGGRVGEERVFSLPGGGEMAFVWIGPGVFQMGSPESEEGRDSNEGPLHEVEISRGFWLGKYEVTQGEWEAVMGDNPSNYKGDARPVERVSWYDVHEFIGRLNDAAGDSLYRLPSEAEWEYACRAGTSTRWSFGNDESRLTDYAWYNGNTKPWSTRAVGQKLPNPWGLYDMYGNVWEWVQDWYDSDYYNSPPRVDPPGPNTGSDRVRRGGYFRNRARDLRSAERAYSSPGVLTGYIGVRLLRINTP